MIDNKMNGDDLSSALACLRSWEPDVRVIGNVRCSTLIALLERSEIKQQVLDAAETFVRSWERAGAEPEQDGLVEEQMIFDAVLALREASK